MINVIFSGGCSQEKTDSFRAFRVSRPILPQRTRKGWGTLYMGGAENGWVSLPQIMIIQSENKDMLSCVATGNELQS